MIKIEYGIKYEEKRVENAISKLKWYEQQNYKVKLPAGKTEETRNSNIEKEFDEDKFKEISEQLTIANNEKFFLELKNLFGKIPRNFKVILTNYGVGGSYNLPNIIYLNINHDDIEKKVYHEIVHLVIQKKVESKKIAHWAKERIVDLILNSPAFSFLKFSKWQENYHGYEEKVDSIFEEFFFSDLDVFWKEIAKVCGE